MTVAPSDRTSTLFSVPCLRFVGGVGHHTHFVEDAGARRRIGMLCSGVKSSGIPAFVEREYPRGSEKTIIVNVVGERKGRGGIPCVVDGNAHLLALCMAVEGLTLARLVELSGRSDIVRIWHDGWEGGSGQTAPYDTYVPVGVDLRRIPGAHRSVDRFKNPPEPTQVIPSTIAFSSPLFSWRDRGRTLGETARALSATPGTAAIPMREEAVR